MGDSVKSQLEGDPMASTALKLTRAEKAAWRDRGYDRYPAPAEPPPATDARTAYFEGYRGAKRADEQGDTTRVAIQRHRRPPIG